MVLSTEKFIACFLILFVLLSVIEIAAVGAVSVENESSTVWRFQNNSFFSFDPSANFTEPPHLGLPNDISLMGYWTMDNVSNNIINDASGNGNTGMANTGLLSQGKFGDAIIFTGNNDVIINGSSTLNITKSITISAWINSSNFSSAWNFIAAKQGAFELACYNSHIGIRLNLVEHGDTYKLLSGPPLIKNVWHFLVMTYDGLNFNAYVDGRLVLNSVIADVIKSNTNSLRLGSENGAANFEGIIDDVRIYNRALSTGEISALYSQLDPASFANYYQFIDSITNNTLIINAYKLEADSGNSTIVTCTNFFLDNKLVFQANKNVTINLWTNLGQPSFIKNGVWNSENQTANLTFDVSSEAEINWNSNKILTYSDAKSSVSPSNITIPYGGSQTFNFNVSQGYCFNVIVDGNSLSQIDNYTMNNVTTSHTINLASALLNYTIKASDDSGSTIFPSGVITTNYGSSQVFTIENRTGFRVAHVYVDKVDKGPIFNYSFSDITDNHSILVSSEAIPSTSLSPNASSIPRSKSSATTSPSPKTSNSSSTPARPETTQFPIQIVLLFIAILALVITGFSLALTKGYITIEVEDYKEGKQEKYVDYEI